MNTTIAYSPINDIIKGFTGILEPVLAPLYELVEKRKIKKSANIFIDVVLDKSNEMDIIKVFEDIRKEMPSGVWNVETIGLVENKLKAVFNKDFIEDLKNNPQFEFDDLKQKNYFIKNILSSLIGAQAMVFESFNNQLSQATIREKDRVNIRLGRELVTTFNLMESLSKDILKKVKSSRNLISDSFSESVKKYWTAYTLLILRIIDIIISFQEDKDIAIKKMDYLGIERRRISSYV